MSELEPASVDRATGASAAGDPDGDDHRMPQMRWRPVVGRRSDCWHPGTVDGRSVLRFYSNGVVASFQHDEVLLGVLKLRGEPLRRAATSWASRSSMPLGVM